MCSILFCMHPFVYRCPNTGYRVQSFIAEEPPDANAKDYLIVLCTMSQQVHLVNPATCVYRKPKPAHNDDEVRQ